VHLTLSFLDKSEYALEKQLWRIQKKFTEISQDPAAAPTQAFDDVSKQYQKVIAAYPHAKLTPGIYLQIGRVYFLKKDYEQSRAFYLKLQQLFPEEKIPAAKALFHVGLTYEAENKSEQAFQAYEEVLKQYPLTDTGLNMPYYIAKYHERLGHREASQTAFRKAISFYKKIVQDHAQSELAFNALRVLASVYLDQKEYEMAVRTLGDTLIEYPDMTLRNPQRADLIIKSINTVAAIQLKDLDLPVSIYEKFLKEYPGHPLTGYLTKTVESLKLLKEKNVTIDQAPTAAP
jgi:tetratricopeptide (TPR) repeat protein